MDAASSHDLKPDYDNAEYRQANQEEQDEEVARIVRRMGKGERIVLATIAGNITEANDYWLKHF